MREARYAGTKIEQVRSINMAVQQNKKSPSKRGMHRAHDFLTNPPLAVEPTTGEVHLRHHISPSGYYRGKKIVKAEGGMHRAHDFLTNPPLAVEPTTGEVHLRHHIS